MAPAGGPASADSIRNALAAFQSHDVTSRAVTTEQAIREDEALERFVANTLDAYRDEYFPVCYALFCLAYLSLLRNRQDPLKFLNERGALHLLYHRDEVTQLSKFPDEITLAGAPDDALLKRVESHPFQITLSRWTADALLSFLLDHSLVHLLRLLASDKVSLTVLEGPPAFARPSSLAQRSLLEAEASQSVISKQSPEDIAAANSSIVHWKVPNYALNPWLQSGGENNPFFPDAKTQYAKDCARMFEEIPWRALPSSADVEGGAWPSVALFTFHNTSDGLTSVATSADNASLVAAGFEDSSVRVYQAVPGELMGRSSTTLVGHTAPVHSVSLWPWLPRVLSGSADGTCRIWAERSGDWWLAETFKSSAPVWDVQFAPCGYYFVSGSQDGACRLWSSIKSPGPGYDSNNPDSVCDRPLRVYSGHISDVTCVAWHPNAHYVATGSDDKTCRLFDVRDAKEQRRLFIGHLGSIEALAFDPTGELLATGATDGQVIVWDIGTGKRLEVLEQPHAKPVTCLSWTPDGKHLASGGADCHVKLHRRDQLNEPGLDFATKNTPLLHLNATSPGVFIGAGTF